MIKKILLILSFFCLFWLNTPVVLAQPDPSPATQPQTQQNVFVVIWEAIVRFFNYLIFGITYISEDYQASTKDTRQFTNDYTREDKDIASRAIPESVKKYRKGVWFYEVLTKKNNKYQDELIKSDQLEVCPDIKITEIIAVMCQQGQNILYERDKPNQPLSCQQAPIPSFTPKHPVSCYLNAYNNIQEVPQGLFMNEENAAPMTSTQLNDTIRNVMPITFQGETAPPTNDTPQQAKKLAEDSDKQERNMLLGILADKVHDQIACSDKADFNRDNLRDAFACHMMPNSWNNPKCTALGQILDLDQIQCVEKDTVKNGPGLSQRGTHGLALSGYKYKDIVNLYHGDGVDVQRLGNDLEGPIKVVLRTDYGKNSDTTCPNLVGKQAIFYDKIDLYRGSGGVNEDGKTPCNKYVRIPVDDPNNPPSPPYELKGICYPVVHMDTLYNYLLGVAEVSRNWHIEAQKALALTHRHTAVQNRGKGFLWDDAADQAFRCDQVSLNLPKIVDGKKVITNQGAAVELTRGEFVVDKYSRRRLHSTARTAFCGPGSYNPKFDGLKYEKISYAYQGGNNAINGICFEGVGYTMPNIDIALSPDGSYLQEYQYDPNSPVLGQTTDNQNNQSATCLLDNRLFSPLNQLISAFNSQNPDNRLTFLSCYRSTAQQQQLWDQYLAENKGDKLKTISQINYPGTSPHQTGRAIDFGDKSGKLTSQSPAYKWLVSNASRFGFYHHQLEPEHWNYKP
ncbi:MAG TPA: D-alanyl-D-alanine carboxypeptidase family protein [Candidatus Woesebacteria bacterium]|nr:D-alanyl-D-alanine carboxypeptidase family protein [Candidatus Woesebacteria bacterium]HOG37439.1 D-alanyl-D-alanine carboxypeptidase family protein [Candidatus Woesebacteria bacterium]